MELDAENLSPPPPNSKPPDRGERGWVAPEKARRSATPSLPPVTAAAVPETTIESDYSAKSEDPPLSSSEHAELNKVVPFSPNAHWSEALNGMKRHQSQRFQVERERSAEYTDQISKNAVATKRIEQFKEMLIVQPTTEELANSWKLIKDFVSDINVLQGVDRHISRQTDRFVINDTHMYACANISFELNTALHQLCDKREKYLPLCCELSTPKASKDPGWRVIALAARGVNGQFYLAISIKRTSASKVVTGLVKMAFFVSGNRNHKLGVKEFVVVNSQDDYDSDNQASSDESAEEDSVSVCGSEYDTALMPIEPIEKKSVDTFVEDVTTTPLMVKVPSRRSFGDNAHLSKSYSAASLETSLHGTPGSSLVPAVCMNVEVDLDMDSVTGCDAGDHIIAIRTTSGTTIVGDRQPVVKLHNPVLIRDNVLYEWIEGVCLSGWMYKWSSKYRGLSPQHKRYFVLRDHLLCYYRSPPDTGYEQGKVYPLTADTSVERCMHMFRPCLKVSSPQFDSLYLHIEDDAGVEAWYKALHAAISLQAPASSSPSNAVKTLWYPDRSYSSIYRLISCDAAHVNDGMVKVALVGYLQNKLSDLPSKYFVDLWANGEKETLELVLTNEMPFTTPLSSIKIYTDYFILSGARGFVGVGLVGLTTDLSLGATRRVMYVVSCKSAPSPSTSSYAPSPLSPVSPYQTSSTVTHIDCCPLTDIFCCADSENTLTFWHLRRPSIGSSSSSSSSDTRQGAKQRPGFYYECKPQLQSTFALRATDDAGVYEEEKIVSMNFSREHCHLLISTTMRMVLLDVAYICNRTGQCQWLDRRDSRFGVVGFAELASVDFQSVERRGLFALVLVDPVCSTPSSSGEKRLSHKLSGIPGKRIVHWKVQATQSSPTDKVKSEPHSHFVLQRQEWTADRYSAITRSIRPL